MVPTVAAADSGAGSGHRTPQIDQASTSTAAPADRSILAASRGGTRVSTSMTTLFELAGALLILGAYGALQVQWLRPDSVAFLLLNATGSGTLAVVAALGRSWGFLLLNVVWTLISLVALLRDDGPLRLRHMPPDVDAPV